MIVVGILLTIAGIGMAFYGNKINNDIGSQLYAVLSDGTVNPGNVWIYFGVATILIGVILIICGVVKMERSIKDGWTIAKRGSYKVFESEEERERAIQNVDFAAQNGEININDYARIRAEMVKAPIVGHDEEDENYIIPIAQEDTEVPKQDDVEDYKNRIFKLNYAKENGLITEEEYKEKSKEILKEI